MSADKEARQASFRRALGAQFSFIADPGAELISLFDVKTPLVKLAKRTTFVIGRERKILHIDRGRNAVNTDGAAEACALF